MPKGGIRKKKCNFTYNHKSSMEYKIVVCEAAIHLEEECHNLVEGVFDINI